MAVCCPKDLKKAVYRSYEKGASSSDTKSVYQRLENLNSPISKLLDMVDFEVDGETFLDLGTGCGVVAIAAMRRFRDKLLAVGLDFSPACLRLAKKAIRELGLSGNINLVLGDAEFLPFKDSVFDVVVSQATINLVPNKPEALSELARVLKARGVLALSDAVKREEIDEESLDLWCQCVTGAFTMRECERIMKACGLTLEETEDLTSIVRDLVETGKWPWPEFLRYKLGYMIMKAKKWKSKLEMSDERL